MGTPELRYADCPGAEAETMIAAAPARVWELVSDITLPARFSSELQAAEWKDQTAGPAAGARFTGRSHHPAIGSWETTCTIGPYEPERVFGWAVGDPQHPSARWCFTLAAEGNGTRLRMSMQIGPARSGISFAIDAMPDKESKILRRRLAEHHANMQATLAGIKELAEA
jgi:uncharacterized protein YndB with AHSA1/START domain